VGPASEISFFEPNVVEHSLDYGDVLRLPAVRSTRHRELFFPPTQGIEASRAQERNDLEWLGTGSPISERLRIARSAKKLIALPDYRSMYSMFRLGSLTAGYCDIEFVRFHCIAKDSWFLVLL
jgi:hypothetical protein